MDTVFSVIGGDLRQDILADMLCRDGYKVKKSGFGRDSDLPPEDAAVCDVLILPLPVSYDNISVNAPLSRSPIPISVLFEKMSSDTIILGGKISEYLRGELDLRGAVYADYFNREELMVQNAIPAYAPKNIQKSSKSFYCFSPNPSPRISPASVTITNALLSIE